MYIPYRKAYISGMNPLSFVTVFTFGELGSVLALSTVFDGGFHHLAAGLVLARPSLFWLFLGGFCWVLGDLFQQYAAKYIGIGRGIPLSNTNQLWGLAWGALVFRETAGMDTAARALILGGSVIIVAGAWAISSAEAPDAERASWRRAIERVCLRYGLKQDVEHDETLEYTSIEEHPRRSWPELLVLCVAVGIFVWLAAVARPPAVEVNPYWAAVLIAASLAFLIGAGLMLWRRTRFS